jgi:hypothetical protein
MIRSEIKELLALGQFPPSQAVRLETIKEQERLVRMVHSPVSNEEAVQLLRVFGPDDYFGLAWAVLHLIESAPGWPLRDYLEGDENEWITRLRERAQRGGKL